MKTRERAVSKNFPATIAIAAVAYLLAYHFGNGIPHYILAALAGAAVGFMFDTVRVAN